MTRTISRTALKAGIAVAVALPLAASGGESGYNRGMQSVHQPVVSYSTFLYDVQTGSGDSLTPAERVRLAGWLNSIQFGYGDKIAIATNGATVSRGLQQDISDVIGQRGMLVGADHTAVAGTPPYGSVRLIVRRSSASVPGCPDWSRNAEDDAVNGISSNHGCAVNSNLAGMIANPEDLVRGQQTDSDLRTATSNRAIETYREKTPSGSGDLKDL